MKGQDKIIGYLKHDKSAYPHKISDISLKETHISWILLAGPYAYKIKKAVKLGKVLDFSTLDKRKLFCCREVSINRVLCGNMYLGVVKIVHDRKSKELKIRNLGEHGTAIEYAVKMRQIPQDFRMDILLKANKIAKTQIDKIAKRLADFHDSAPTSYEIGKSGRPDVYKRKIQQDLQTLTNLKKISSAYEKSFLAL